MTPSRSLVPAGQHRSQTLTPMYSTGTGSNDDPFDGNNGNNSDDHGGVYGSPTTGTTSPTTPHLTEHDQCEEPSPMPANIGLPQVAVWEAVGKSPRASDYSEEVCRLILTACTRYEVYIATVDAFPSSDLQNRISRVFFKNACHDIGTNYQVTDRIMAIVSGYLLSFSLIIMLTHYHLD